MAASRGSNEHRKPGQPSTRSEKPWANKENDNYDDDDNLDHEEEASPSEHATRHEHLEEEAELLRLRALYPRAQSSTGSSAKARKKGNRHQSSLARPADSSRASRQDGSLLQDVYNDLCRIPGGLYPLLRLSYSFLKWPLLLYILWIIASHALVACMNQISQSVEPYCGKPIIGNMIPFCPGSGGTPNGSAAKFTKAMSSQEELDGVMESVGQNHELARAMSRHDWVLRDLRIRVAASKLRRKTELVRELDSLIQSTDDAAWAISSFTAKVSKATDVVIAVDEDAVKKLEAIEDRQNRSLSLQQAALSMLSPLSAFRSTGDALTEEELKEVFLTATSQIAGRLPPCIADAWELHGLFKKIQSTLDRIQELAVDEMGDLPQMAILASLWNQLARADEYAEHRSHKELLEDLTGFYKSLGERTVETISALKRISSELKEFRDEYASAKLILRDFSLKVTMSTMRKSTERLESGRRALERIENGERRGTPDGASTRTVYATAV